MKPPRRTFGLRDAVVLVAATAVALAWLRSLDDFKVLRRLPDWLGPRYVSLVLLPWTFAIVGLRLLQPRPPFRRLVLQPGAAACGAVALSFTIQVVLTCVTLVSETHGDLGVRFGWNEFGDRLFDHLLYEAFYHVPVLVAWGLLLLSRRCRPEPTWIDRVGRAIGLTWLLLGLWYGFDFAIETLREGGR